MQNFESLISQNRFAVDNIFRTYKATGVKDIDKIRSGYEANGDTFMMKLLSEIVPKEHFSNFTTTLMESKSATPYTAPLVTDFQTASDSSAPSTGKGWTFWSNFLTAIGTTAKTAGTALADLKNPQSTASAQQQQAAIQLQATEATTNKTLYVVAGVFLAVILIVLIMKK